MKTSDFDFSVPDELIAHEPSEKRDHSRLMVIDRARQSIEHSHFYEIVDYLNAGDILVLNDTKVIPANLIGKKEDGEAKVEILLVSRKQKSESDKQESEIRNQIWECLVKPGKRLKVGSKVVFGKDEVIGEVLEKTESGEQIIEFEGDIDSYMQKQGEIPLPPYIKAKPETLNPKQIINHKSKLYKRYQTVFAEKEGASAAPTAGLHFTPELLKKIEDKGVKIAHVTLHTGLATFKPVYAERVEEHKMYSEYFEVLAETIEAVKKAKRVVAVGTTSVRTLETIASVNGFKTNQRISGETRLFIYPGYKFKIVDAMITNFHWPRTTLIMLVSAFAGRDFVMKAYQEAIDHKYRFFSFGDAMLII
jgi:S-adenosylmethionine:tRNA ribosyltransferase-isomerase